MERYIVSVKGKTYYFSDRASADSFAAYCNDIYHTDLIWATRANNHTPPAKRGGMKGDRDDERHNQRHYYHEH